MTCTVQFEITKIEEEFFVTKRSSLTVQRTFVKYHFEPIGGSTEKVNKNEIIDEMF